MKEKSITLNAVFNMSKTVLSIVFPIITFPYISRVLSVDCLGQFGFGESIISYFILFASLGIDAYAIREGAKYRTDRNKISQFCSDIYTISIFSTLFSYIMLGVCIVSISKLHAYYAIILILSLEIFFNCIGVNWIYYIFEDFFYITIITFLFQIISLVSLFVFVKGKEDFLYYVSIVSLAKCGANVFFRVRAQKYVDIKMSLHPETFAHLLPVFYLFSTSITSTIYINSDITILGFLSSDYNVGLYSVSMKIYSIVKRLLLSILVVSTPRSAMLIGKKRIEECKILLQNIESILLFICIPAIVGIISLSKSVIILISGQEFIEASQSLKILGAALLFSVFSSFSVNCILIPMKKERFVLAVTSISAVINLFGNILFIPWLDEIAAAITTLLSEMVMSIICGCVANKYLKTRLNLHTLVSIILGTIGIVFFCGIISNHLSEGITKLFISMIGSIIIYLVIHIATRSPIIAGFYNVLKHKGNYI